MINREYLYTYKYMRKYKYNINENDIINITNEKIAYFLGFLWADGWVNKYSTNIEIKRSDYEQLENVFEFISDVPAKHTFPKGPGKEQSSICLCRKTISDFLIKNGYKNKSIISPKLILKKIPIKWHNYFWRGYFDGDGCLCIKNRTCVTFWGSINQDWSEIINLYKKLNIKYYDIRKYIRKNGKHKSSCIEIRHISEVLKLCEYMYKNYETDNIGLKRKFNIYLNCIEKSKSIKTTKTSKYKSIIKLPNGRWKSNVYNKVIKREHFIGYYNTEKLARSAQIKYCKKYSLKIPSMIDTDCYSII